MSDSYKVRVKHLTEENTVEASEGEMIISQVTGHISVKDKYFVNSATKDIAARNSALYNFYNDMENNVNILEKEITNFNNSVNRINRILNNIIKDSEGEFDKIKNNKEILENKMNGLINDVEDQYKKIKNSTDDKFIAVTEKYIEIERDLKEIELLCREFKYMEQYIINQKYVYYENYKILEEDSELNKENYNYLRKLYEGFINEMKDKYESLQREFPEYKINFEGGVNN